MEKLTEEELNKFVEAVQNSKGYIPPKCYITKEHLEKMIEEGLAPPDILDNLPVNVTITVPVMQEGTDRMGRIWTKEMVEEIERQTAEWFEKMKNVRGKRAELHPIDDACEYQTGGLIAFTDSWEE